MVKTPSLKRLILRAVLRQVSLIVIRLVSVSDHLPLIDFPPTGRPLGIARQKGKIIDIVMLSNILYRCNHNII